MAHATAPRPAKELQTTAATLETAGVSESHFGAPESLMTGIASAFHNAGSSCRQPRISSSSFSCTCICITNHFFSLTDTAASASAILLQQATTHKQCRSAGVTQTSTPRPSELSYTTRSQAVYSVKPSLSSTAKQTNHRICQQTGNACQQSHDDHTATAASNTHWTQLDHRTSMQTATPSTTPTYSVHVPHSHRTMGGTQAA